MHLHRAAPVDFALLFLAGRPFLSLVHNLHNSVTGDFDSLVSVPPALIVIHTPNPLRTRRHRESTHSAPSFSSCFSVAGTVTTYRSVIRRMRSRWLILTEMTTQWLVAGLSRMLQVCPVMKLGRSVCHGDGVWVLWGPCTILHLRAGHFRPLQHIWRLRLAHSLLKTAHTRQDQPAEDGMPVPGRTRLLKTAHTRQDQPADSKDKPAALKTACPYQTGPAC